MLGNDALEDVAVAFYHLSVPQSSGYGHRLEMRRGCSAWRDSVDLSHISVEGAQHAFTGTIHAVHVSLAQTGYATAQSEVSVNVEFSI